MDKHTVASVSYTHLDVYKRQQEGKSLSLGGGRDIARTLAEKLGFSYMDREIVQGLSLIHI